MGKGREEEKMQLFVRNLVGKTTVYNLSDETSVFDLKRDIEAREGVPAAFQRLVGCGKELVLGRVSESVQDESTLNLCLALEGGVIEPTLQALARKYNCDKKVCRKCYARLPPRASNCRKRKCGHCNQLFQHCYRLYKLGILVY